MRRILATAVAILALAGCTSSGGDAVVTPSGSVAPASGLRFTSPDFADGDELADWATANAFGGQCTGDNLNPAFEWTGVPEGTKAFAITLIDRSANNYIHWVQFDIPGDATGFARGAESSDGGIEGATANAEPGYFGPCPPGPDHRYEFTLYALDAPLGLEEGARFADVKAAIDEHALEQASIVGMRSGPA